MTTTEPTVEQCLEELREMFPGEFFRVEVQQCAQVDDNGNIWWREKRANIMMLSRGLDNFPSAPTLSEAMAQVRKWHSEQSKES